MASPASSDEGEIRDGGSEKATTSLPHFDGTSVDRQDRNRSRNSISLSPRSVHGARDRRSLERSRSPYSDRVPRGSKRSRDEDYSDRNRGDPRRFKVHYEDTPRDYKRRPRVSYDDIDNGPAASSELQYDDRERNSDGKRQRTRSRSPYRNGRGSDYNGREWDARRDGHRSNTYQDQSRSNHRGYGNMSRRGSNDQSVSKREQGPLPSDNFKHEAKSTQGQSLSQHDIAARSEHEIQENHAEPEAVEVEPVDEAALIEERRKRREAIKAKYKGPATSLLVQALHLGDKSGQSTPGQGQSGDNDTPSVRSMSPATPNSGSPTAFSITDDQDLANTNGAAMAGIEEDGPSAADYDPTMDMREDKDRDTSRHNGDVPSAAYNETRPTTEQDILLPAEIASVQSKPKKANDEFDMFAEDDDDDMFAEDPNPDQNSHLATPDGSSKAVAIPQAKELDVGMLDNWDDPEGYYKIILGELLNGRYHVQANLGKGMFSGVVRAQDITSKKLVAIKLIRNNETMRKAGMKEIEILQKINDADPDDKKHMIRLERYFEHKGHLCMVFENLSINLREVLKKFGRDVGINLKAVRAYAQQMFLGLSLMRKCNILHADLKPDNMLVNETRNMLKICDLGSASDSSDNEITPYLVSRFYRAPEIILGMQYDFAIDIWSVGCTLYELYTGKILFTGRSNNQMLRSIMDCRGKFPTKMLKRSQFAYIHFDEQANFRSVEQDKITGKDIIKTLSFVKPSRDLRTRLFAASKGLTDAETKELNAFTNLLEKCLALNPEKRITPTEALKDPFITRIMR
ncbi:putative serine kinase ppk5 [Coleophoma crateriformis]|uniref:non-specific serine/threonine protein kinase n=1 Tax=Coleophoma crateriformis TaxID=565419 RepID=A0A3D8T759_9HELO|nr:putative serine kinase ppk5 [Coleophoma crateriformis]